MKLKPEPGTVALAAAVVLTVAGVGMVVAALWSAFGWAAAIGFCGVCSVYVGSVLTATPKG